jgi:hypothetical protein
LLAKFGAKMTSLLAIYTMKWFKRNCTYPVRWRGLPWRQTSLGGRYHGDRWSWWRTSTLNPTWNPTWNLNGRYWRAQKALLTCQYHSDSCRKIVLIGQFCESWIWVRRPQNQCESAWNLESFALEASCLIGRRAGCHHDGIKGLLLK